MLPPLVRGLGSSEARAFAHAWRHRLANCQLSNDEIRFVGGPRLHIHPDARNAFNFFGMYNADMVQELRSFLTLTRSRRCLIDVGAHYGLFSLAFASRSGAVAYAVEPSPAALRVLNHHRAVNPGLDVRAEAVAFGSVSGQLSVEYEGEHDHVVCSSAGAGALTVPVLPLDTFLERMGARPDTLKVDVEGMELEVLAGAHGALAEYGPQLFLEVHPAAIAATGRRVAELEAFLRETGYAIRDTRGRAIKDLEGFCSGVIRRIVATR